MLQRSSKRKENLSPTLVNVGSLFCSNDKYRFAPSIDFRHEMTDSRTNHSGGFRQLHKRSSEIQHSRRRFVIITPANHKSILSFAQTTRKFSHARTAACRAVPVVGETRGCVSGPCSEPVLINPAK